MADTANFSTDAATLNEAGGAWVEVITGALTDPSVMAVREGEAEWIEAATGSTPAVGLFGNVLSTREGQASSQPIAAVAAGQGIFARALGDKPTMLVVTPASA